MRILDQRVENDLRAGRPLSLQLGCGDVRIDGFYGVDRVALPGVAVEADLEEPLGLFPDDSVAEVLSHHCFEHVRGFLPLMSELFRVVRPGGRILVEVPHFSNPYAWSDPTHVRTFGLYTMFYFVRPELQPQRKVPVFYSSTRFRVLGTRIKPMPRTWFDRIAFPFMGTVINRSIEWQDWYERRICRLFPAWSIVYEMTPDK